MFNFYYSDITRASRGHELKSNACVSGINCDGYLLDNGSNLYFCHIVLPIELFPILEILNPKQIAENYAHYIVLLILGSFFIAKAIETNNLHKRIVLATIKSIGISRAKVTMNLTVATAFLSMWTSIYSYNG